MRRLAFGASAGSRRLLVVSRLVGLFGGLVGGLLLGLFGFGVNRHGGGFLHGVVWAVILVVGALDWARSRHELHVGDFGLVTDLLHG